jgi:MinD-like ATPase involved in chromosome partitioning or flagellar assembly
MNIDVLILSGVHDLRRTLEEDHADVHVATATGAHFAQALITSNRPPQGVYVDNLKASSSEVWAIVQSCQARHIPVFVGLLGSGGESLRSDLRDAGIAVVPEGECGTTALAHWIAQGLGLRPRLRKQGQALIAVASAKGGIGKTQVVLSLAEGLRLRGLRVLVVDGDLANSGIVPTCRIASGFKSYLQLRDDSATSWSPETVRASITKHESSGLDLLLGCEDTALSSDITIRDWHALMRAVQRMDEYDVVLVDTGPDIVKRPYAVVVAAMGGYVLLPVSPGRKERCGAGNTLQVLQQTNGTDLTAQALLVYMEPERGVCVDIDAIAPLFAHNFPLAKVVGRLVRDPSLMSRADEATHYVSPIQLNPYSTFALAVYDLVENVCHVVGVHPPQPKPRLGWTQRVLRRTPLFPPIAHTAIVDAPQQRGA